MITIEISEELCETLLLAAFRTAQLCADETDAVEIYRAMFVAEGQLVQQSGKKHLAAAGEWPKLKSEVPVMRNPGLPRFLTPEEQGRTGT